MLVVRREACCLPRLLSKLTLEAALKAYEPRDCRRRRRSCAVTARKRLERVLDAAAQRGPEGFARWEEVISPEGVAAIVGGYA